MNKQLLQKVIEHVFASFGIIPTDFIDIHQTKSLVAPEFLLNDRLSFDVEGQTTTNKVWGCQLSFGKEEIKVLLGDCSDHVDEDVSAFAMVICPKSMPSYGLYLARNFAFDVDAEPLLACSVKDNWMECNTFLQGTFLAAMEQVKETNFLTWSKCTNHSEQFQKLQSFIRFHSKFYEDANEE